MKLLSLNIWGGKVFEPLIEFIKNNSDEIDIFCFQEVFTTDSKHMDIIEERYRSDIFSDIENVLPNYKGYFAPNTTNYDFDKKVDYPLSFGLAIFIKRSLVVDSHEYFTVAEEVKNPTKLDENILRIMQLIKFKNNNESFSVFNIHGLWVPDGKDDNPRRIKQSEKILEIMNRFEGKKILCGDFNLNPDTKSIGMLASNLRNLIKQYDIKTTRNSLTTIPEKFADYTFVSRDVKVINFSVPNVDVSDHLPMILEFD